MIFDAELAANHADPGEPPSVAFRSLDEGALLHAGEARKVEVDAIDPDGQIQQVAFFVDDQRVATRDAPPFVFEWTPEKGAHRLRAMAIDDRQRTATQDIVVTGLANVPPIVRMRADAGPDAGTLTLSAEATDPDGQIREVEFFLAAGSKFDAPMESVGKVASPPFRVTIRVPEGAHRMVAAVATDDGGETGEDSTHVHGAHANTPAQAE
jgi:hypothetical protein